MRNLVPIGIAAIAVISGCSVRNPPASELEFSESLAEERRQIGVEAVDQIELPDGFEIKYTTGTPAEAPSLSNQNNPLPADFTYHIDIETDVPTGVWINELKAEIESHGQLEGYDWTERRLSACAGMSYNMSFRHVGTGDLLTVDWVQDRPSQLSFSYRYSTGGVGSFGPVESLFRHAGPACDVSN